MAGRQIYNPDGFKNIEAYMKRVAARLIRPENLFFVVVGDPKDVTPTEKP